MESGFLFEDCLVAPISFSNSETVASWKIKIKVCVNEALNLELNAKLIDASSKAEPIQQSDQIARFWLIFEQL